MTGNLGLLTRLRLRHLRSDARFLLFAAGADIDEDRGFLERTYQLYLVIIFAVAIVLSWAQVVDLVESVRDEMGSIAGSLGMLLLMLAPPCILLALTVDGLRETPLRLTSPDIAWLARVARPQELLAVQLFGNVVVTAVVSALLGYLLGVLTRAPSPLAWAPLFSSIMVMVRLLALALGLTRSAAPRRRRRVVTLVAGAVSVLLAAALLFSIVTLVFLLGAYLMAPALALSLALVALSLMLASRASMAFVVDDNELYAARQSLRFLSLVNAGAYKEACRRRRSRRDKKARRTWSFRPGRAALVSHGLLSLVRRPSALLGLFSWGALLVPTGALLMATGVNVGVLLSWLICVCLSLRTPLELGRVFREDCRNRLVRGLLPFGRLEIVLLDSLPALVVTLILTVGLATPAALAVGTDAPLIVLLACALDVLLTLSSGLDDPVAPVRLGSVLVTGYAGAVVALFLVGLASLLGLVPALACALIADVILVAALR